MKKLLLVLTAVLLLLCGCNISTTAGVDPLNFAREDDIISCEHLRFTVPEGYRTVKYGNRYNAVVDVVEGYLAYTSQNMVHADADCAGVQLCLKLLIDAHNVPCAEGGLGKAVLIKEDDGHTAHGGHVGALMRHGEKIRRVLHKECRRTVVGVVIVGSVRDDHVGVKLSDITNKALTRSKIGNEDAVILIRPNVIADAEVLGDGGALLGSCRDGLLL